MITITPQGSIYLCKTPLERDYKNQLTFSSKANQETYFTSTIQKTLTEYTYIKKDNTITIGEPIDTIINCNYLFYVNTGFTTKYYYCFINKMEYVNENVTRIYFETDVFQTYQFDIVYNQSFIEREHVNDDSVGLHTIPEGLETGDYIVNERVDGKGGVTLQGNIIVGATIDFNNKVNGKYQNINGTKVNGVFGGLKYFVPLSIASLKLILEDVANAGQSDGIVSMFIGNSDFYELSSGTETYPYIVDSDTALSNEWKYVIIEQGEMHYANQIFKPTQIGNYTPVNKKLLTFPYCYINCDNNNGSNAIYKYELFSGNECDFIYYGATTPGMSIRLFPKNYNNQSININEGVNVGKYPICSWNSDVYTNWLTQNSVNVGLNVGSALLSTGVGVATSNPIAIASGLIAVANSVGEVYKHSLTPPQIEGNTNNGDVMYSFCGNKVSMYLTSIKEEMAQVIDKFFSMYGYKVNIVKTPNITGRTNWNYVKTIDNNFDGDIPQEYLQTIKKMFNDGVTLWHNASTMYDYSQTNSIVS